MGLKGETEGRGSGKEGILSEVYAIFKISSI